MSAGSCPTVAIVPPTLIVLLAHTLAITRYQRGT